MAVYAAHLTRTLQGAPSVFQVVAQEALGGTVKPAFGKLIEYLATVYPDRLGWCERWYDEIFLCFDCFLQYHYLKHYAASFSESFYGLVRDPVSPSGEFHSGSRLPRTSELGSLAVLVLLPYLRDKLENAVSRWRDEHEDGLLGKGRGATAKRAAMHVYSTVHLVASLAKLVQLAAYLRGAPSPTPSLAALGLTLKEAPPQEQDDTWGDLLRSLVSGQFGSAAVTFPMLGSLALRCVEYGAFAVQFLRWWESRAPATDSSACPPPPQVSNVRSAAVTFPMLGSLALRCVEYGAFAVQFLRWWESRAPATDSSACPPPPQVSNVRSAAVTFPMLGSLALRCVEYGAFAVQFLRWWESRAPATDSSACPPPPQVSNVRSAAVTFPMLGSLALRCVEYGAFAVQFLRWWESRAPATDSSACPPPPQVSNVRSAAVTFPMLGSLALRCVEYGAFAVQFLRWWESRAPATDSSACPPPPQVSNVRSAAVTFPMLGSLALRCVEYGAFAVQFLRWWESRAPATDSSACPPPPQVSNVRSAAVTFPMLGSLALRCVEYGAFAVQFLRWWESRAPATDSSACPPPPQVSNVRSAAVTFPMLGSLALRCVEYGAFAVQFLRWWESRAPATDSSACPPPPQVSNVRSAAVTFPMLGSLALRCVEYGAFAVQFLRWWESRAPATDSSACPPPPQVSNVRSAAVTFPMLGSLALRCVEYGAFAVQFLRWWESRAPATDSSACPPPPQVSNVRSAAVTFPMLGSLALRCVEYGAFAVQFLRWWESRAPATDSSACPPPPQVSNVRSAAVTFPMLGSLALRCVEYGAFAVQFLRWWESRAPATDSSACPPPPQVSNVRSAAVTFPMLGSLALRCVEYGAFAVQFLRWWESRAPATDSSACPPPPQRGAAAERWHNKCPVCLQRWKTPTALPVSGLIFCYGCISRHLRAHGACPATRLPASEADLVRVYID